MKTINYQRHFIEAFEAKKRQWSCIVYASQSTLAPVENCIDLWLANEVRSGYGVVPVTQSLRPRARAF